MRGDPLEIELLLLNVMKNAAEAVQGLPDGAVLVKFRRETLPSPLAENPSPSPAAPSAEAVIVEVEDNGPRLSDEAFERLTRVSQTNAFAKLGVHSPGELLKMAYEAGIVSSAASAAESSDAQAF